MYAFKINVNLSRSVVVVVVESNWKESNLITFYPYRVYIEREGRNKEKYMELAKLVIMELNFNHISY